MMIYNFMFTAAPPLAMGFYEKRLHEDILSKSPRLYRYVSLKNFTIFLNLSLLLTGPTWKRLPESVLAGDA